MKNYSLQYSIITRFGDKKTVLDEFKASKSSMLKKLNKKLREIKRDGSKFEGLKLKSVEC